MPELNDGSVLPHFLELEEGAGLSGPQLSHNDFRLRVGYIVKVHAPSDASNNNKRFYEYDVNAEIGGGETKLYPYCVMMDPLGGMADFVRWTPRIAAKTQGGINTGSRVLLLCVNGHSPRAIIIGGVKHHGVSGPDDKALGHHLLFRFNGMSVYIDQDGAMRITHGGKTDGTGKPVEDKSSLSSGMVFDVNGNIKMFTDTNTSTLFQMDSENSRINLFTERDDITLESGNNIVLKSTFGVMTGEATDATLMGSTFRSDLTALNATLLASLELMSGLLTTAGTSTAAFAVNPALVALLGGPTSPSTAGIAALATTLTSMSILVHQMAAAIQQFELKAAAHLSLKNKSD